MAFPYNKIENNNRFGYTLVYGRHVQDMAYTNRLPVSHERDSKYAKKFCRWRLFRAIERLKVRNLCKTDQ